MERSLAVDEYISLIDNALCILQESFKYDEHPTTMLLSHYGGAARESLVLRRSH